MAYAGLERLELKEARRARMRLHGRPVLPYCSAPMVLKWMRGTIMATRLRPWGGWQARLRPSLTSWSLTAGLRR